MKAIPYSTVKAFRRRDNPSGFSNYESPSACKVRELASKTETQCKLSGFDLISWKQRTKYNPTEMQKKLKF